MDEEIRIKLNEIIDIIDNNSKIKRMKELKKTIYEDKDLKELLDKYHTNESIELKKQIIENDLIKEYRQLENELYFTILEMNKRLNKLISKKVCNNESN